MSTRTNDYALLVLSVLCGGGAIALMVAWPSGLVPLGLDDLSALLLDGALSVAFFVQHSVMVRRPVKARMARVVPERYVGAIYAIASGVVLALVVVLWQRSPTLVLAIDGPLRWVVAAAPVVGAAGFVWGAASLHGFDPLALGPIRAHLHGSAPRAAPFTVRGAYRWVRHPLYASLLLVFWGKARVSADQLLFDVLWTAWIVLGTVLEERDLVAEFGDAYRTYRRKVPMLFPWHAPRV